MVFKVKPPTTAKVIIALPATLNITKQIFSWKVSEKLFVSVAFLVVVSIKRFNISIVPFERVVCFALPLESLGNGNTLSSKSLKSTFHFNDRCAVGKLRVLLE